ncbi:MAG: hypothetical protein QG646_3441 [Euryarchaeota archaeon]|nr:hypothetical protein [Euryarchaeota archaeon]
MSSSPDSIKTEFSTLEIGRAIILGAVFGQSGIEGGLAAGYIDQIDPNIPSSPYYLIGWIGFSLVPGIGGVADVRDAVQSFISGDELGAALNAAGALSGIGDGVKTGAAISLFLVKYPSKLNDVQKVVVPLLKYVPLNLAKKVILDILHSGAATRLLDLNPGATLDDLIVLAERGVDLQKTIAALRACDGRFVWLGEGIENSWGWLHIIRSDRWQQINNKFGPKTADEVKQMIYDTLKQGQVTQYIPNDRITYTKKFLCPDGTEFEFSVGVSDRPNGLGPGRIITARPGAA